MNSPNDQSPPEPGNNEDGPEPDPTSDSPTQESDSLEPVAEAASDSEVPQPESEESESAEEEAEAGETSATSEASEAEQPPAEASGGQAPPFVHQTSPIPGNEPPPPLSADQPPPPPGPYGYGPPMPMVSPYPFGHPNAAVRGWAKLRFRWKRARRPGLVLTIVLSVLVLFISLVTFLARQQPEPVQAVEDYLTAVKEEEVEAILRETTLDPEWIDSEELLTPEALDSDWDIDNLELVHEGAGDRPGTQEAIVEATLKAPNGTTATSDIALSAIDEDWRVQDALTEVILEGELKEYLAVNGVNIDLSERSVSSPSKFLFPGVYDFSLEAVEILEAPNVSFVAIGDTLASFGEGATGLVTDEETGESQVVLEAEPVSNVDELAQGQVDAIWEQCSAEMLASSYHSCPFNLNDSHLTEVADPDVSSFRRWEEHEYHDLTVPEVTVEWNDDDGFIVSSVNEGTVEFTAEIADRGDDESTVVTFDCTYGVDGLNATLEPHGGVTIETSGSAAWSEAECQVTD